MFMAFCCVRHIDILHCNASVPVLRSETLRVNMNLALTGTCLARHHLIRLVSVSVTALPVGFDLAMHFMCPKLP